MAKPTLHPNPLGPERSEQAKQLALNLGFGPGTICTVIDLHHSPRGSEYIIHRDWIVSGLGVSFPGDEDEQVSAETCDVTLVDPTDGTQFSNCPLADLANWRTMDAVQLEEVKNKLNEKYWAEFPSMSPAYAQAQFEGVVLIVPLTNETLAAIEELFGKENPEENGTGEKNPENS